MQKIIAVFAVVGLCLSFWVTPRHRTQAAAQTSRILSAAEMGSTQGAGNFKVCSARTCNDPDGCDYSNTYHYAHHAKTVCTVYWYDSQCDDSSSGDCYDTTTYTFGQCGHFIAYVSGPTATNINYCGV